MHFKTASIALAALSAVGATAQSTSSECHSYVIISIRGTYEVQGRSIAFTTMINDTFAAIPGGIEYDAVYPAAPAQTAYLGADDVTRYINNGLTACPDQKYAILGYSQGASATMLTLANITDPDSAAYNAIKAVIVVGNPYHIPNATLNIDEFGGDKTRMYPGSAYNANNSDSRGIPQIYYSNGELLDICHTEDVVCAPAYPNASFIGHLHYGDENVQNLGKNFLISRLGGDGANGTGAANGTARAGPSPTGDAAAGTTTPYTGAANVMSISIVVAMVGTFVALGL